MAYNSPYQPNADQNAFRRMGVRALEISLRNIIIWGSQLIKFVVQFVIDAIKQVIGR